MSWSNKATGGYEHQSRAGEPDDNDEDHRIEMEREIMLSEALRVAAAESQGPARIVLNWQVCIGPAFTPVDGVRVEVQLPGFVSPCPLPYPAMCIHVVVDRRIPLGVPYIANRQALMRRTLTEDMGLRCVNFEHRHIATEAERFADLAPEQLQDQQRGQHQHISAGLLICHPADILIVEGWRECESRWWSSGASTPPKGRYTSMARRGRLMRDMWPWIDEFATFSLQ
ncbi:hypothetical protein SLS62_004658 [Diatrype stigma]|uniref:Uncharacterized protein n=1 Tax=Diatrype stigma TaxID=117547 RepID=A0AAN9V4K0_9PEZI